LQGTFEVVGASAKQVLLLKRLKRPVNEAFAVARSMVWLTPHPLAPIETIGEASPRGQPQPAS